MALYVKNILGSLMEGVHIIFLTYKAIPSYTLRLKVNVLTFFYLTYLPIRRDENENFYAYNFIYACSRDGFRC